MSHTFISFLIILSAALLLFAAMHDAATRTIPNWMPASLAVAGMFLRIHSGDVVISAAIAAVMFALLAFLWLRGLIGGADVKLIPAASLLVAPSSVPVYVFYMTVGGGVLALLYLLLSRLVRRPRPGLRHGILARVVKVEAWRIHRRGPLPYAVAIAVGALPLILKNLSN